MYTLLIVDDEPNIQEGLQRLIDWRAFGIEKICTAGTYSEVVSNIVDWKPDICLVDVCIGNEYGFELIRSLNDMGVETNYVMMSGYDNFSYACEALRCGALDYLLKPIAPGELESRIEKIIVEKLHGTLAKEEKKQDPVLEKNYEEMSPLIRKIVMMTNMEYGQDISLKSIADRFRMNSTYLGQIFIKETGIKFSEYLMKYRMYIAREKILNSDEKIAVIASDVGYSNVNYFYQHFHDLYNITPSEIRAGR